MARYHVHACTDVTGFGLLGHAAEMIEGTDVGMRIRAASVPILPEALEYAATGIIPAGAYRNKDYRAPLLQHTGVNEDLLIVLCDPQTSGGLLISLPQDEAARLLDDLHHNGIADATLIGEITTASPGTITLVPE